MHKAVAITEMNRVVYSKEAIRRIHQALAIYENALEAGFPGVTRGRQAVSEHDIGISATH